MHWKLLSIALVVSVCLALLFLKIIVVLGLKDQLMIIVPILPVFYGLIFPILEKTFTEPDLKVTHYRFLQNPHRWRSNVSVVVLAALASLFTQCVMDAGAWAVQRSFVAGLPIPGIGDVGSADISALLRGSLPHLQGRSRITYLTIQMLVVSLAGGLCAGLLSEINALLNGLLAGVIVSVWMGANQFSVLYERLAGISTKMGSTFHLSHRWANGVMVGLFVQVFLFSLFSGLAYGSRTSDKKYRSIYQRK